MASQNPFLQSYANNNNVQQKIAAGAASGQQLAHSIEGAVGNFFSGFTHPPGTSAFSPVSAPKQTFSLPTTSFGGFTIPDVSAFGSTIKPTASGGVSFPPPQPTVPPNVASSAFSSVPSATSAAASPAPSPTPPPSPTVATPVSQNTYSINTDTTVPSSEISNNTTAGTLNSTYNQYADYVRQLAAAQQYSPAYLAALQGVQNTQRNQAQLEGNLAFGGVPGDTLGYAQGITAKQELQNSIAGLGAQQALQVQELIRQGNIAGANALVQAAQPSSVSPGSSLVSPLTGQQTFSGLGGYQAVQGIQTVNNLAQQFPDANIQPGDSLQTATQKAATAPSFQSRNLVQVTLPGGGIEFVNRNQLKTNPDGTYTIVSSGDAAAQSAAKSTIADLTKQRADTQSAITTADANFPLLLQAVKGAKLNNNAPLINEIQQKISNKTSQSNALAALNTLIPSLQAEYSRIIARGGTVDDKTRNSAQAIINGTYTFNQLQTVYDTVQKEGANIIKGFDDAISKQQATLGNTPHNEIGSSWDTL